MVITNWLAKADGCGGLVTASEFTKKNVRIYGNVYGHSSFVDGEFVQTGLVTGYDGCKITTSSGEEYTLLKKSRDYENFLKAVFEGTLIMKKWSIDNGLLIGTTLAGVRVAGKVISQNMCKNTCVFKDGRDVFVDWLSKDPNFVANPGIEPFFVFGIERCMPDIFGKHFWMFRKN